MRFTVLFILHSEYYHSVKNAVNSLINCFLLGAISIFEAYNFKYIISMPLTKKYLKTKPVCKVTFTVPAAEATTVAVAGDFNNWDTTASLKKLKNGNFKGTFDIPTEQSYEFRYVIDGEWTNEQEADRFEWNSYAATENSVIEL